MWIGELCRKMMSNCIVTMVCAYIVIPSFRNGSLILSMCMLEMCYRTVCSLGKSQPKQQMCDTIGDTYHCHLNRYLPHFSEGQVQHKGGFLGDPRGIAMGQGKSSKGTPIGQGQGRE